MHPRSPRWNPGAWTPNRCALWRTLCDDGKKRLERWIMAEYERGRMHSTEPPKTDESEAA